MIPMLMPLVPARQPKKQHRHAYAESLVAMMLSVIVGEERGIPRSSPEI
jgi:hypothetical protein